MPEGPLVLSPGQRSPGQRRAIRQATPGSVFSLQSSVGCQTDLRWIRHRRPEARHRAATRQRRSKEV